ncbi:LysR substrate-binding domain-containing protein [Paraburkholderia sp. CNPSo 3076]|uniref:LysR substrate-binding domain-containing protein n=1 Tax=Paraburkholderia sp. CNPSo 3076 TaxID=2940936 RepID=UPI00225B3FDA|nr:LysR substrate-binding domain-containing protein [Paraburkholderia sp. CNPSo 3076]MCX5543178.1 LysR substrate-binding domain-containing protein [Paraburkholderia sp. CNPSo 3076]
MKAATTPELDDLRVFCTVARKSSFSAAADALCASAAYVSKRVGILEARLGTRLLHRSTRRVAMTAAGERVFSWAEKILDDVDQLVEDVSSTRRIPRGTLRVSSSFGFGRKFVAPALAALSDRYQQLNVQLDLFDRVIDVVGEGFDLDVRIGDDIAGHLITKRLATNYRVLCAAPSYLAQHGSPQTIAELESHACLAIKERDHPFGVWRLDAGGKTTAVKVTGPLSTNHGEAAVQWALAGRGIVLRSIWDVGPLLDEGRLQRVLPDVTQPANVWAVFPERLAQSAKVKVCVDFLVETFAQAGFGGAPPVPDIADNAWRDVGASERFVESD